MAAQRNRVVFLGASGAVGGESLKALLRLPEIGQIDLLLRRSLATPSKASEHIVDVLSPASYQDVLPHHDIAICTLGVGQPSKTPRAEFTRVDKQAVLDFARACKAAGVRHFSLLGSVDANPQSRSFYLRSKGELRDAIAALGFERFSVFQPSMILTPHNRYGVLQGVMLALWPWLKPLLFGGLAKYRGIEVDTLGTAMARNVLRPGEGLEVFHWEDITQLAAKA
jgi:uncharacterized protein YbjT (DUF2867 family)